MSDYTDQRDRIVALVSGVTDVGRVHARPRWGDAYDHWTTEIDDLNQIRAWEVSLDLDVPVETDDREQHWKHRWHPWIVRGWVSLVDGTDDAGDPTETYNPIVTLATSIADAIDADRRLNSTCIQKTPVQIDTPAPLFLPLDGGDALCWHTALRFRTLTVLSY